MKYFEFKQILPVDLQTAWDFFSSPANLQKITPAYMGFKIRTPLPEKAYPGLMIYYTVTPNLRIPMKWVTEISHVHEPHYFVDEQRLGPYAIWHHEHHFRPHTKGVEMVDKLSYHVGFGVFGQLADFLFVERQITTIFNFRNQALLSIFGEVK